MNKELRNENPKIGDVLRLLTEPEGVLSRLGEIAERIKALIEWTERHEKRHEDLERSISTLEKRINHVDLQHAEEYGAKQLIISVLPFAMKAGLVLLAILLAALEIKGIGIWQ